MPRLIWVFAGHTATLLVLSCRGSHSKIWWGMANSVKLHRWKMASIKNVCRLYDIDLLLIIYKIVLKLTSGWLTIDHWSAFHSSMVWSKALRFTFCSFFYAMCRRAWSGESIYHQQRPQEWSNIQLSPSAPYPRHTGRGQSVLNSFTFSKWVIIMHSILRAT